MNGAWTKRAALLAAVCVAMAARNAAGYRPSEWVWFAWPHAYDMGRSGWVYFNPSDSQRCYRYGTPGEWIALSESGLAQGWTWWIWPFAFSLDSAAWHYVNEADSQWCLQYRDGRWSRLGTAPETDGMLPIPAGGFPMGDSASDSPLQWGERPVHTVTLNAFFMDATEVSKTLWDEVYAWAVTNGYRFENPGSWFDDGSGYRDCSKGFDHPVHSVSWYDAVKWCNARSEMRRPPLTPCYYTSANHAPTNVYRQGRVDIETNGVAWDSGGYRLPTEAEWERAARGLASGGRFPWGDSIGHDRANYWAGGGELYDESGGAQYHPTYAVGRYPYTCPVASFGPNDFGLYNVSGNVSEWCWDRWSDGYYAASPGTNPRGPDSGAYRILRGGAWSCNAILTRCAVRDRLEPDHTWYAAGFRCVRGDSAGAGRR
jgi:formylglycine-generating enzyme required for sulfatase activity